MPRGETGIGKGSQRRVGRKVGAQPRWQDPDIRGGDTRGRRGSAAEQCLGVLETHGLKTVIFCLSGSELPLRLIFGATSE